MALGNGGRECDVLQELLPVRRCRTGPQRPAHHVSPDKQWAVTERCLYILFTLPKYGHFESIQRYVNLCLNDSVLWITQSVDKQRLHNVCLHHVCVFL